VEQILAVLLQAGLLATTRRSTLASPEQFFASLVMRLVALLAILPLNTVAPMASSFPLEALQLHILVQVQPRLPPGHHRPAVPDLLLPPQEAPL